MGGSGEDREMTIRLAGYIEARHANAMDLVQLHRNYAIGLSPYSDYDKLLPEEAMLGAGYVLSDFPSLFDVFGKFMSGLDVELVWEEKFNEIINEPDINGSIVVNLAIADQDILQDTIPSFQFNMQKINAVNTSTFVLGKAKIECDRTRKLAVVSSDSKFKIISNYHHGKNSWLNWQKDVVERYGLIVKQYFLTMSNAYTATNYKFEVRNVLWPFTVLEYERAMISLTSPWGAGLFQKKQRKRSDISKGFLVASYTVSGAVIGAEIGGPWGAVIGGVIGFVVGIAIMLFE